jgi:hypothetical protein
MFLIDVSGVETVNPALIGRVLTSKTLIDNQ